MLVEAPKSTSLSARIQNCPSHGAANLRRKANVKAWRYLFAGEFPNHTLGPCCPNSDGAWHGSELGLIFGTTESRGQGKDTDNEKKLAKTLRDVWSGFAKDPVNGLEKMDWPVYDAKSKSNSKWRCVTFANSKP
jgi:carboxylesterase type B